MSFVLSACSFLKIFALQAPVPLSVQFVHQNAVTAVGKKSKNQDTVVLLQGGEIVCHEKYTC